jgi:hypothetical protein
MADVYFDEVFVAAGETVLGFWEIPHSSVWGVTPETLVVWEPAPYDSVGEVLSFTYNETQITLTVHQAIINAAEARRCDLIVMASHGRRAVSAVGLGSETVKVLTHSKIPVLVYR